MAPMDMAGSLAKALGGPPKAKKPAVEVEIESEGEGDEGGDLEMAAQDLIDAVKAGDAAGVASAMRACYAICGNEE